VQALLGFLEQDLIPDIEEAYRTVDPRILQDESLSGLFTAYALRARSTAFKCKRWVPWAMDRPPTPRRSAATCHPA
jgi:predicted alpha/beta superfamily hydrolase